MKLFIELAVDQKNPTFQNVEHERKYYTAGWQTSGKQIVVTDRSVDGWLDFNGVIL